MKKATIADLGPAAEYGRLMESAAAYVRVERPKLGTPELVESINYGGNVGDEKLTPEQTAREWAESFERE